MDASAISRHLITNLLIFCSLFILLSSGENSACQSLENYFDTFHFSQLQESVVRVVSPSLNASNTPDCLCRRSLCSTPQYALHGDQNETDLNNITIILESGVHVINDGLSINSVSHISFIGIEGSVMQCGQNPDIENCNLLNVHVKNSSFIYFQGVTFQNCGSMIANVHVQNSDNVVFQDCVFKNNPSSAVHLYQATSVAFRSCLFESNIQEQQNLNSQYPNCYQGQNDNIFFLDSRPTAGALSVYSNDYPIQLLITDTQFVNNSARPNNDKSLARALLAFGHGGAMFIRLVNTSNSLICIENSKYIENSAEANGGGIQLSGAQSSSNNQIMIRNCTFSKNRCNLNACTGGAIGIDYFENSHENQVHVVNSSFNDNSAIAGGVLSLVTSVGTRPSEDDSKPLWFKDCLFLHNMAKEDGSVFSLFSVTLISELGFPAFVENCRFEKNIALDVNKLTAAVSLFRVAITFDLNNVFNNNFGGGLVLTESRANINGSLQFYHNFAYNGGGIAMYGRCLVEMYMDSDLSFDDNYALRRGGGLYVEYVSADFIFSILNRGCFIQYFSEIDQPPNRWRAKVNFTSNTAGEAGAAVYASDMSRCLWYGPDFSNNDKQPIFVPVVGYDSPFSFSDNILANNEQTDIDKIALATDAINMTISPELSNDNTQYTYSEMINFHLFTFDQFKNFREALWQVSALEEEELGAISTNGSLYSYAVPNKDTITNFTGDPNNTKINLYFTVNSLGSEIDSQNVKISLSDCHPGYTFNGVTCECENNRRQIVRCDGQQRYFYVQEGLWVGSDKNFSDSLIFASAIPGFLYCNSQGNLPGCLYKFDDKNAQCAEGREGILCSMCSSGYGLSFDLLSCHKNCSPWGGILAYVIVCILIVILSLVVLYFDVRISNKLKCLIFYGQVIGVIYRNSPYLNRNDSLGDRILNFIVNLPGTPLPFPFCFHENASGFAIAWLGIVPPSLALATAIIYILLAQRLTILQNTRRNSYGLHGLHLITLFIYKYFLDTAFTFVNIRRISNHEIFSYSGESGQDPLAVTTFVIGLLLVVILGFVAPIMLLVYIYRPQNHRQFVDAFTRGIKNDKKYLWYSVWDIWRRLPFIGVNLLISVASVSIIVLLHVLLVIFVMSVHCITKPYRRDLINFIETCVIFCLFGATLAILDENDIYVQEEIAITFILLPFIYGVMYALFLIIKTIFRKCLKREIKANEVIERSVKTLRKLSHLPQEETPDEEQDDTEIETSLNRENNNVQRASIVSGDEDWHSKAPLPLREPLLDTM